MSGAGEGGGQEGGGQQQQQGGGQQQQQQAPTIDYGALYGTLSPENKEIFERKGWGKAGKDGGPVDINAVFESYRGVEKLVGTDKIPAPRLDDPEALNSWEGWKKLGVPDKPEDYKIKRAEMPKGADGQPIPYDEGLEKVFLTAAHKAKVPAATIQAMYDELISARVAEVTGLGQQFAQQKQETEAAILKEFGASVNAHTARAKEAWKYMAGLINVDENALIDKVDAELGSVETIKLFDKIAEMLGEDTLKGGGDGGFKDSPAAAKAEQTRLMSDENFMKVYRDKNHPNHRESVERMSRLQRLISGSK